MTHEITDPDERFQQLHLVLPPAPKPIGVYRPIVTSGGLAHLSGHGPLLPDKTLMTGRVGDELDKEAGYQAARQAGLALIATLREAFGSLDRIERIIKLFGMVNCIPGYTEQPAVINGCSELIAEIWGPNRGVGARSAVGVASLPEHMTVEVDAIFKIRDDG